MLNEMLGLKDDYVDHGHDCLIQIMLILGSVVIVGWPPSKLLGLLPMKNLQRQRKEFWQICSYKGHPIRDYPEFCALTW
jgi:hypothetical protein